MGQIEMFEFHTREEPMSPIQRLMWIGERYGSMVSQRILTRELKNISKQRISQLLASGRFETFDIEGEKWITVRSIRAFQREEKALGGRPRKKEPYIPGRIETA
jgi:hypothetical protein